MSDPDRYDRLPTRGGDGMNGDEPTRESILEYWRERFDVPASIFDGYTFWEKGADSVWAVVGDAPDPIDVEALGIRLLRTGGRHWKPTTDGVQRFGAAADRNVIHLNHEQARRFVAGNDQPVNWEGDWGYLIASTTLGRVQAVLGVGLFTYGELASNVPKARRIKLE